MTTTPYRLLNGIDRSDVRLDLVTFDPSTEDQLLRITGECLIMNRPPSANP